MTRTVVLVIAFAIAGSAHARFAKDRGPDLPYSCAAVRSAAAIVGVAQLEAMARARGITVKQRAQAIACLRRH